MCTSPISCRWGSCSAPPPAAWRPATPTVTWGWRRRSISRSVSGSRAMPNPFAGSRGYARLSNVFLRPLFGLLPVPRGFALLTVTGRRSGRPRQRPVRAVRRDATLYAVAMLGQRSDWLRNIQEAHRRWAAEGVIVAIDILDEAP